MANVMLGYGSLSVSVSLATVGPPDYNSSTEGAQRFTPYPVPVSLGFLCLDSTVISVGTDLTE